MHRNHLIESIVEFIRPRKIAVLILIPAALILGVAVIATNAVSAYRMDQLASRSVDSMERMAHQEQLARSCQNLPAIETIVCAIKYLNENRAEARGQLDLVAQQDMAFWALLLLLLTGLGLFLSAGGVVALVWTFWETRLQTRLESCPYLITHKCLVSKIWDRKDPNFYQLAIEFEVNNCGNTPALDVTILSRMGWSTSNEILKWNPQSEPTSRGLIGPGQAMQQSRRFELNFEDWAIEDKIQNQATVWVRGIVRYRDIYNQWWEHSFAWLLRKPDTLLNSRVSKPKDKEYLEYGMSIHETLNDLKRIPKPI